jgi:riboflavin kinase/FMN adenylyltransferase
MFCAPESGTAVAIGNFDGVHRGHRAVLDHLIATAKSLGVPSVVYTFDPAPTAVVAPDRHQPRLQCLSSRVQELLAAGVSAVVVEPFTPAFAAVAAASFASEFLAGRLRARALVVGHDFRFGNMRGGDAARLREWLPGVGLHEVGALCDEWGPISSSRVRKLLIAGQLSEANALLGRPHRLTGTVVRGEQRGRTLGFPTANLEICEELRPAAGVYAAHFSVAGQTHKAAVNLGIRPTVGGSRYAVEAHVLDFEGDLYGVQAELSLVARVRDEVRFAGLDALRAQIAVDVTTIRGLLS